MARRRIIIVIALIFLTSCALFKTLFNPEDLSPELHWVRVENIPVVYTDQGEGAPLIILSPYPLGTFLWTELSMRLGTSMRVIVVEPPGLREPNSMNGDLSSEHLLQIYRQFKNKIGLGMVHVMGIGETGGLAVSFGHHFPQETISVISLNGFQAITWSTEIEKMIEYFNNPAEEGLKKLLSVGSIRYSERSPASVEMDRLLSLLGNRDQRELVHARFKAYTEDIKGGIIFTQLPNFNLPLLLLKSGKDSLLPERYIMESRRLIIRGEIQYQTIPEAGHMAFLDQPEILAETVRNFIQAHPIPK